MKVNPKTIAWLVGSSLVAALVVVPSLWAFRQTTEASAARRHTYNVIERANGLLSSLINAETGQRGYLLTNDEVFLEPYTAVRDTIRGQLSELRQLASIRAAQKHLDALAPMMDAKLVYLANNIELCRTGDLPAALANVRGSQGKPLMDSIRDEFGNFIKIENDALAADEARYQAYMRNQLSIIVITSLLTLLFALMFA